LAIVEFIKKTKELLKHNTFRSEAAVSQGILLPALHELGWPVFDTSVVIPEYSVEGRRVDYALCHPATRPSVFIEVKNIGLSEGADRQLFEYAFHIGVPMAILTDGQEWSFYLPGEQGRYDERRVYKLDLLERTSEEASTRLTKYLSYERVCSGEALKTARSDYQNVARGREIESTFPRAWASLLQEEDSLLLDLLAEKVEGLCGYRPDQDDCRQFLQTRVKPVEKKGTTSLETGFVASPATRRTGKKALNPPALGVQDKAPSLPGGKAKATILKVTLDWSALGRAGGQEVIEDPKAVSTFVKTLAKIAKQVGNEKFSRLRDLRVNRGTLLSANRTRYHLKEVAGYHVLTYNSTNEKAEILQEVVEELGISKGFLGVEVVAS
jgi:hypothetical protein